ncbi:MAG: HepT-like ribonuclease domain-containing protein [Terriglobia bacterium]
MKDDSIYLKHILDSIRRIEDDISEGREKFLAAHTLQDAVLRNLQTLSESAKRLSDPLTTSHPEIEWRRITAFRNILVHDYLGIDMDRIWRIVQDDVPQLKRAVTALLALAEGRTSNGNEKEGHP